MSVNMPVRALKVKWTLFNKQKTRLQLRNPISSHDDMFGFLTLDNEGCFDDNTVDRKPPAKSSVN